MRLRLPTIARARARRAARTFGTRAFTLIELMVVIVLMAVLSAMILPEMRGSYEDALLRSSARKLANALGLAYSRAVTLGTVQRLELDRRTGRYALESQSHDRQQGPGFLPVKDVEGAEGEIDPRIGIQIVRPDEDQSAAPDPGARFVSGEDLLGGKAQEVLAFYPDGTADPGQIILQDREGFKLALRINPITARVRIVETEP